MNRKAFTLVEVIATITILGVLIMIAVPSYNRFIKKADNTKCKADENAIIDAAKVFINDCIYENKCKDGKAILDTNRTVDDLINNNYLEKSKYEKYKTAKVKIIEDGVDYSVSVIELTCE